MYDFQLDFGGNIPYDVTSVNDIPGTLHLDTGDLLVLDVRHPVGRGRIHTRDVDAVLISRGISVATDTDDSSIARVFCLYPDLDHTRAPTGGLAWLVIPAESLIRLIHLWHEIAGPIENGHGELEVVLGRVPAVTFPPALPVGVAYERTSVIKYGVRARGIKQHGCSNIRVSEAGR